LLRFSACSPFRAAGINICSDECRPWRFSDEALFANALSVFQGEVDHPFAIYLNFTLPTKIGSAFFHLRVIKGDIRTIVNATGPSGL
jgi:hypothetical protein